MGKIIAKGMHIGTPVTVTCEDEGAGIVLKFDNERNELYEEYFFDRMNERPPIAGGYVPEKCSMLNALNVCEYYFFDDKPEIKTDGDIGTLPYETDVVY